MSKSGELSEEEATKLAEDMAARLEEVFRPFYQDEFNRAIELMKRLPTYKSFGEDRLGHLAEESHVINWNRYLMGVFNHATDIVGSSIVSRYILDNVCVRCPVFKDGDECPPHNNFKVRAEKTCADVAVRPEPDSSSLSRVGGIMIASSPKEAMEIIERLVGRATKEDSEDEEDEEEQPALV